MPRTLHVVWIWNDAIKIPHLYPSRHINTCQSLAAGLHSRWAGLKCDGKMFNREVLVMGIQNFTPDRFLIFSLLTVTNRFTLSHCLSSTPSIVRVCSEHSHWLKAIQYNTYTWAIAIGNLASVCCGPTDLWQKVNYFPSSYLPYFLGDYNCSFSEGKLKRQAPEFCSIWSWADPEFFFFGGG